MTTGYYAPTRAKEDPTEGSPRRRRPVRVRLLAKTRREGECLIWTGAARDNGYGVIGLVIDGKHVVKAVHRVAFEEFVGPLPVDMHVDHLCSRRLCVEPSHLEAVTQAENNRRMKAVHRATECQRGHEFTEANTFQTDRGFRECRECRNARNRAARKRAALLRGARPDDEEQGR